MSPQEQSSCPQSGARTVEEGGEGESDESFSEGSKWGHKGVQHSPMPYVYTGPLPETRVHMNDFVFVRPYLFPSLHPSPLSTTLSFAFIQS